MTDEERIKRVEDAILIMKDLVVRHEERLDGHDKRLERFLAALDKERQEREEANKDFNFKLNALIDAQLRNEADIGKLKESSQQLKEASESQLKRIENLEKN